MGFWSNIVESFTVDNATLSAAERAELETCLQVVRRGLGAFLEAGEALLRIRDKQLYRQNYPSFEAFAVGEFNLTGRRLHQLIESFEITKTLKLISPSLPTPAIEAVVRPLASLPAALQVEAFTEAVEAAGGESPTPRQVRESVARRKPASKVKASRPVRFRVPGAIVEVTPNKAFPGVVEALEAALSQARQAAAGRAEAA